MVVGISGKLWSGKDTLCEKLIAALGALGVQSVRRSWADALKHESALLLSECATPEDLWHFLNNNKCEYADDIVQEVYYSAGSAARKTLGKYDQILFEMHDPELKKSYRKLNQWWGTEYRRVQYDQLYWVKKVLEFASDMSALGTVTIVADTRFPNEAEACDVCVRINRTLDRSGPEHAHPSETLLDDYTGFRWVVPNDGTPEWLDMAAECIARDVEQLFRAT